MKLLAKKNISPAFTLIELLIYMGSFAFFATVAFGFLVQTQKKIFSDSAQNEKMIRNNIALDLLKRDLICASANKYDWDTRNFVFRKTVLDKDGVACPICVGWQIQEGVLFRIEGEYNFVSKKWNKKNTSKVQNNIEDFIFSIQETNDKMYVQKVELSFGKSGQFSVLLRNRRVG